MARKILEVIPSNKISYENLVNLYNERKTGYGLYFAPLTEFTALTNASTFEYTTVKNTKLLKFSHVRHDSNLVFKVSDSDYLEFNQKGYLESNMYKCKEKELTKEFDMITLNWFYREPDRFTEIILSKEEYERYLISADDYLVIFFKNEISIFNLIKKEKITKEIYNFSQKFENFKELEGLFLNKIIIPIIELYTFYNNEITKKYIGPIISTLDDLFDIKDNISKERHIDIILKINNYLNNIIEIVENIPYSKIPITNIKTAEEIIKINQKKESTNNCYDNTCDDVDKLLERIDLRNRIYNISNN